jgi:SPP1 family phage portal protein
MKKGIEQIKLPIRPNDLTIEKVEPYLSTIFKQFETISSSIRADYDKFCLDHPILQKVRIHKDSDENNIVLIPDLNAMVEWKTGYVCGNPIKYSQTKTLDTDDMQYLNKYIRNSRKRVVDKEVCKWAYATGVGYYFIEPKSEAFDIESESPFELYCRNADSCIKIYSSYGSNKPLFDILYTEYEEIVNEAKKKVRVMDLYLPDTLYTYEQSEGKQWRQTNSQTRGLYRFLPLIEKRPNSDGIGIVAKGEKLQDALDKVMSDCLDNVGDIVNEVWVYYNILLGKTPKEQQKAHQDARKNGAIQAIATQNSPFQPKIETISTKLSLNEVMELFSIINQKFHSSVGVPMEMSNTNSGNTTKQGSEVANGYDNAYNKAIDDINTFINADTELLERIMWICKANPNNKIDNVSASEIEIKYVLNLTDNILTKTQSFVNLIQAGMPPTMALRICRISNDPEAEGKEIEEYVSKKKAEELKTQQALAKQTQQGNNSQELIISERTL